MNEDCARTHGHSVQFVTKLSAEAEFVTQRLRLDAVDGDPLAVDLDHRDPLAVARARARARR